MITNSTKDEKIKELKKTINKLKNDSIENYALLSIYQLELNNKTLKEKIKALEERYGIDLYQSNKKYKDIINEKRQAEKELGFFNNTRDDYINLINRLREQINKLQCANACYIKALNGEKIAGVIE